MPAQAGDTGTSAAEDGCYACLADGIDEGPGDLVWASGEDDDLMPILSIHTQVRDGLFYLLQGRIRFQGIDYRWTQDLGEESPDSQVDVILDADALVAWSDAQADWTSDLVASVTAVDSDGVVHVREGAATLRVVWVDGVARLLTTSAAGSLAPHGAWSAAAQAADPYSAEDEEAGRFQGEGTDLSTVAGG